MKRYFRKMLAFFMAIVICFSIIPMSDLSIKASAASKTVAEAMQWCESLRNQKIGSGQCVAFIQAYYEFLGASPVSGHAYEYSTNDLPSGWSRVKGGEPQAGDILVYTGAKYGHVAICAGGSVSYHQNMAGTYVEKKEAWPYYNSWFSDAEQGTKSYWGYIRPDFSSSSAVSFNAAVDSKIEDGSTIDKVVTPSYTVAGWAYCSDGSETTVYWCIDDGAAYVANKNNRQDVVNVYGCRLDCGFDFSVPIKDLSIGTHKLSIWVSNATQSADVFTSYFTVTSSDKTIPSVSSVAFRNYATGFDVTCLVDDNYGVAKVIAAVWTDANGQDDLTIHDLNLSADGKSAWGFIDYTKHNSATGIYCWDIYVYDYSGNEIMTGTYSIYVGNLVQFWWLSNPDNTESWIDTSGTPTVSGIRKFWFKEWDVDTNYYLNILVDGQTVVFNSPSDADGYISYVIDTGTMTDGLHSITAVLADSKTSYTATKEFYVNNLIAFTAISSVDNNSWFDVTGTPQIFGTCKIWFKKESPDSNYYIDMYVDDVRVEHNMPVDADGNYSYTIDTTTLSNGEHTFRAELFDSKSYYTATKTMVVKNTCSFDINTVIDNEIYMGGKTGFTYDLYLNGEFVADDISDSFNPEISYGTTFEIKDIKHPDSYVFTDSIISGTITEDTEIRLNFATRYDFDVNVVIDETVYLSGKSGFSFDLKLNNSTVSDDAIDYASAYIASGTIFEINDIRCPDDYYFTGGTLSGTVSGHTNINLNFEKKTAPSNLSITTEKQYYTNAETITFTVKADNATYKHIGIHKIEGDTTYLFREADVNGTTISLSGFEPGHYRANFDAINAAGTTRSDWAYFSVCDTSTHCSEKIVDNKYLKSEATCTSKAIYYKSCSVCGAIGNTTFEYGSESEHSYKSTTTPPTCTEKGYTTYTCACGDTYIADYVNANGHNHEAIVTPPTCTSQGYTTYICACGDSYESDLVDVIDHADADNDYLCDNCGIELYNDNDNVNDDDTQVDDTINCSHMCHKSGFAGFFWKIIQFFWKLFKMNPVCECGMAHY